MVGSSLLDGCMDSVRDTAPSGAAPWGRLLLTGTLPLLFCAAQQILLPGIDADKLREVQQSAGSASTTTQLSIVAIGLAPVMSGFFCAELAAVAVPKWRALRSGALAGRQTLRRAALLLSLLLALLQGFFVARWLVGVNRMTGGPGSQLDMIVASAYGWFTPITTLTLAAGTFALLALARAVERYALGGGLSVLVMTAVVRSCVELLQTPSAAESWLEHSGLERAQGGCLVLGVLLVVTLALQRPIRTARGASVQLPACGLIPLHWAAAVLLLPGRGAEFLQKPLPAWLARLTPGESGYWAAYAGLALAAAVLLARLFSSSERPQDRDPRTLNVATLWSIALQVVVAAGSALSPRLLGISLDLVALAGLPAVLLDLAAEWRLRRAHRQLTLVWTCAHLPAAHAALARLTAAGIPSVIRSLHHRSLWHIAAPCLEMDVLVPAELAERSIALLDAPAEPELTSGKTELTRRGKGVAWVLAGVALAGLGLLAAERAALLGDRFALTLVYELATNPLAEDRSYDPSQPLEQGLEADAAVLKRRLKELKVHGANARVAGNQILVELPSLPPSELARLKVLLGRRGELTFRLIDSGTEYMRKLAAYVDSQQAELVGLTVGYDAWRSYDSGEQHVDAYLKSPDRAALKTFLAQLPPEWAPPPDRTFLLERLFGETDADQVVFRTYLAEQDALLTDRDIADAAVTWDTRTGRPEVTLTFTVAAAARFEELTGAHAGRRLAIILDNEINSAPVIEGRVAGGRARITLGGFLPPAQLRQEARDLVAILLGGSLPLPLVLATGELPDGQTRGGGARPPVTGAAKNPASPDAASDPAAAAASSRARCRQRCAAMSERDELRAGVSIDDCIKATCSPE